MVTKKTQVDKFSALKEQIFTHNESFEKDMRLVTDRLEKGQTDLSNRLYEVQISTSKTLESQLETEREKSDKKYAPIIAWTALLALLGLFGLAIGNKLVSLVIQPTP